MDEDEINQSLDPEHRLEGTAELPPLNNSRMMPTSSLSTVPPPFQSQQEYWSSMGQDQWRGLPQPRRQQQQQQQQYPRLFPPCPESQPLEWQQPRWQEQQTHTSLERPTGHVYVAQTRPDADHFWWNQANLRPGHSPHEMRHQESPFSRSYWPGTGDQHQHQHSSDYSHEHHSQPHPYPYPLPLPLPLPHLFHSHPHLHQVSDSQATWALPDDNSHTERQRFWTPTRHTVSQMGHPASPSYPESQTLSVSEPGSPILSTRVRPTPMPYRHRSKTLSSATSAPYQLHRLEPPSMNSSATATSELPLDPNPYASTVMPELFRVDSDEVQQRKRGRTSSLRYESTQRHHSLPRDDFQPLHGQQGYSGSHHQPLSSHSHEPLPNYSQFSLPQPVYSSSTEEPMVNYQNKRPLAVSPPIAGKAKRVPDNRFLEKTLPLDQQPNPSESGHSLRAGDRQPMVPGYQSTPSRTGYPINSHTVEPVSHGASSSQSLEVLPVHIPSNRGEILKQSSGSLSTQHLHEGTAALDTSHNIRPPPGAQSRSTSPLRQAPSLTRPRSSTVQGKSSSDSSHEGIGSSPTTNEIPSTSLSADISPMLTARLGKLLVATKKHIMDLLLSFLSLDGYRIARKRHPRLEQVLVDLVNDMLLLHSASSMRDNISSQERPTTFQPTHVLSLSHLRELSGYTEAALIDREPDNLAAKTLSYSTENRLPAEDQSKQPNHFTGERANEYGSTVEFLALMTAFVSVVCWLLQSRLDEASEKGRVGMEGLSAGVERRTGIGEMDGGLLRFLSYFHDRDNILKPIQDALAMTGVKGEGWNPGSENVDSDDSRSSSTSLPSQSLTGQGGGLFTWHFLLFSEDPDSPSQWPSSKILLQESCSWTKGDTVAFDVILNELYSTQVLALTAKDHQKDHGQFYTPPAVVDFMWTRATSGREGRLLDRFVQYLESHRENAVEITIDSSWTDPISLIPKALDPCLGVSTFLSRYARLLIKEARHKRLLLSQSSVVGQTKKMDMDISVSPPVMLWDSVSALRLLLRQICDHAWGLELDDFAYWLARCGFMANLIPLIQRIEHLSHEDALGSLQRTVDKDVAMHSPAAFTKLETPSHNRSTTTSAPLKLPRLHLFCNDTLQLTIPGGMADRRHTGTNADDLSWERSQIMRLRDPTELLFDFIVTNPPYMIRKTGTFSTPDPLIYDWKVLGAPGIVPGVAFDSSTTVASESPLDADETADIVQDDESDIDESGGRFSRSRQAELPKSAGASRSSKSSNSSRGMMQAYGYFIWFAAQRILPKDGVLCMITASQWLTLDFAIQLRAWLFENCLMDELFQFEPYKVFAKVQTDSLIFKIRTLPRGPSDHNDDDVHETLFLRHLVRSRSLSGILEDYTDLLGRLRISPPQDENVMDQESSIALSRKSRHELQETIMPPRSLPSNDTPRRRSNARMPAGGWNYSFAPMMPTSNLTEHMLRLTRGLGGICSAGTKKQNRLQALEPLLWHRGPNTNPVYGLVVRMEYAEANFGLAMTKQWFRPALYWNGKNSPQEGADESAATISKALHKEGQFWQSRDRLRLSKKEGSPAESYLVPNPHLSTGLYPTVSSGATQHRHRYALCMIDKEAVKVLKRQKEGGVEGAQALWNYLVDVRDHFQPGFAASKTPKGKKASGSGVATGGKKVTSAKKTASRDEAGLSELPGDDATVSQQMKSEESLPKTASEDEGVAFCSTNQCGADVPEKIVHPINYGYFSKSQPRQRFFLDRTSLAVTNQCIYLTLNTFSLHQDALHLATSPHELMMYFLTLLNSSTLQFFVLHTCQYDQQGRMRLFRESMAKIPFQDRDLRTNNQQRMQYVVRLGQTMIDLKEVLYDTIKAWRIGENFDTGSSGLGTGSGAAASTSGGQSILDCIRRGGEIPVGVLDRTREHLERMLGRKYSRQAGSSTSGLVDLTARAGSLTADTDTDTNSIITDTDTETDDNRNISQYRPPVISQDLRTSGQSSHWSMAQSHGQSGSSSEGNASHYQQYPLIHSPIPIHPTQHTSSIQRQETANITIVDTRYEGQHRRTPQRPATTDTFHTSTLSDPQADLPLSTLLSALPNPSPSFSSGVQSRSSSADAICDRAVRSLERAMLMVEVLQWAVDQYGYMLYGVSSSVQIQLEKELKLVYSSALDEVLQSSIVQDSTSVANLTTVTGNLEQQRGSINKNSALEALDILLTPLYRWDLAPPLATGSGSVEESSSTVTDDLAPPTYASSVLKNAQIAVQQLKDLLDLNSL
ncbi:hypothetical protein EMPS_09851 [Entomortierella parvispora]|uniref:site-specific DNA-methyltransferase (adenine-specific) n=1 Tax=Entomortierella parvispora TaxID=205924 RepID=A0A9P3HJL9_9FUNG|nr:hypothetical protein EMPS_09851 [Entomortierella parvispora]